jgi:hypothetical protein
MGVSGSIVAWDMSVLLYIEADGIAYSHYLCVKL